MLRLDLPTESHWVECPYGVRLLCRPLTSALNHAAIARAARRLKDAGGEDEDPDIAVGRLRVESVVALGEVLIEAWEGVGNAEGTEAAPLTPDGIRILLAVPEIERAFNAGISAPLVSMAAEGNA